MQSLLLTKGLRITDDDPIFAVVALAEMAVNDANAKHLEELNSALLILQNFQVEMRAMTDAALSATEILSIGRQFLSGENEQILEDVGAIKGSIQSLSQKISIRNTPDEDWLNKVAVTVNSSLSHTMKSISGARSILHSQNEAFLIHRVKEITASVQQLKDIDEMLRSSARERIDLLVAPVVQQMNEQAKKLAEKDTFAMRFMQKTNETQEKMATNIWIICVGVCFLVASAFMAGTYFRSALSG
jgi:hypothetical protein